LSKFFETAKGAKAELQWERDKLGEPRQGERARVDWPPLQKFLLMAELLWKNGFRCIGWLQASTGPLSFDQAARPKT
jgi:hypothetical protein